MLCNVQRYSSPDYHSKVPLKTSMENAPPSLCSVDFLLSPEERLKHLHEGLQKIEASKELERLQRKDEGPTEAAEQTLVYKFLLEGEDEKSRQPDAQRNNKSKESINPYPLYGVISPGERLHRLQQLLHQIFHVRFHPPLRGETREQYWRRLGLHYAKKEYDVCHDMRYKNGGNEEMERKKKKVEKLLVTEKDHCNTCSDGLSDSNAYGDPFYIVDFGRLIEQMAKWREALPMVRPFYAVKCNPYCPLVTMLAALGAGFDCASQAEIQLVKDIVSNPEKEIIFAQPCKRVEDIHAARRAGVRYTTVDNEDELEKLATHFPEAKTVLRLATDDSMATCQLSSKFGAQMEEVESLLRRAAEMMVEIWGVSFHVGSGNSDAGAYVKALNNSKQVFELAKHYGHTHCHLLDIGGGYPGSPPGVYELVPSSSSSSPSFPPLGVSSLETSSFEHIAKTIRPILENDFKDAVIISEPGRYFAEGTHALLMHVFGKRKITPHPPLSSTPHASSQASTTASTLDNTTEYQYYVNDGLYHSFNCILYDHAHPYLLLLEDDRPAFTSKSEGTSRSTEDKDPVESRPLHQSTIFGPTCDSLDCLVKREPFPEMCIGDWLLAPDMGSYSTAGGSCFNGIATRRMVFVSSIAL